MARFSKYPPERLAELAAESRSVSEVLRKLGLPILGGHHTHISRQLKQFGIDTSHFTRCGQHHKPPAYTRDELTEAAATSHSFREMLRSLGAEPSPSSYGRIRAQCSEFAIDTSHFRALTTRRRLDPDRLREAVAESQSIAGVVRALELPHGSAGYRLVRRWADDYSIDLTNLPGQAHNRGKTAPRLSSVEILRHEPDRSKRQRVHLLRRALTENGRAPQCAKCGIVDWHGAPIILEVDHINGDWRDNRSENLRYLCPNCHSQTDTFCGRNASRTSGGIPAAPLR